MADNRSFFMSLRWKGVLPLVIILAVGAMIGAYVLADAMTGGTQSAQDNVLLAGVRAASSGSADLYDHHRAEAQRAAFTVGVAEAVRDGDAQALEPLLQSLIRVGDLDAIVIAGADGSEILGIQRSSAETTGAGAFALSTNTYLGTQALFTAVLEDGFVGATGILLATEGPMLFTAVPVPLGDQTVGVAMVGQTLDNMLASLSGSAYTELVFYGPQRDLLATTFPPAEDAGGRVALAISSDTYSQALLATDTVPVTTLSIDGEPYQAAYQPFAFGPNTLGVVGTFMPDDVPLAAALGRQLVSSMAAVLAGAIVLVAYIGWSRAATRVKAVGETATALAQGREHARVQAAPTDEIGVAATALDRYADYVQEREEDLRQQLQRRRRQATHLLAAMDSMPDGVVMQDIDGRVLLINDRARDLLGSQRVYRSTGLHELADLASDQIGHAIAPGIYALGDPHRVALDDRMLSAQAAAVVSTTEHRLGTVIVLRDITDEVRRERERDLLIDQLYKEVQQPLEALAQMGAQSAADPVRTFAREITRHAVALQKTLVDMREVAFIEAPVVKRSQRPLRLETLVWAVVNEWRQVARANGLTLHVMIQERGLYVLGDEKRLRWAIGNLIDNAIKYTLVGGVLSLEIRGTTDDKANLRVRDNGVGILKEDLPRVFTRFYRGTPLSPGGSVIHVPGMGQGLYVARQIIKAHGGSIEIRSKPGKGTAAMFTLPLTSPQTLDLPLFAAEADMDGETVQLPQYEKIMNDDDLL